MNIGSIFLTLLADGSKLTPQVQQEAQKAGDAGAKTLGQRLGSSLKTEGLKIFGTVASAAFGLATKGALEMENATARFRAETGASGDEAVRVGKLINKVAGDERMALETVTDIAIRVRRDLGATGDAADALTAKFARYARVTRQDAATAVTDFDDILDAWNLTADQSSGVMDKLLASQQRWGGDITTRQRDLAALAPQLKALNATVDDGIALQNLFAASGLDSSKAMFALNTAVKKVKPGETIDDLIKQVSSIEDPTLRAQKAIEIFGARGGVSLANVLRPGIDSLDDFQISMDEAAGSVDEAADVLDSTWSGRISKFFSQVSAAVRGFGADFGAAAAGLASMGTLLATLGGGKLLRGLANVTLKPLAGLGIRIATFLAAQLAGGAVAGRLAGGMAGAIGAIPGASSVKSALTRAGTIMGSRLAVGFALGFATLGIALLIEEVQKQVDENKAKLQGIGADIATQVATGTTEQLTQSRDALKTAIDQIEAATKRGPIQMATPQQIDALKGLVEQYNIVQTELNNRAAGLGPAVADGIDAGAPAVGKAAARMYSGMTPAGAAAVANAKAQGELLSGAVASGIREKRNAVTSAMGQLIEDLKNAMSPAKEQAQLVGFLTGAELAKGLKSRDPLVKAQAESTRAIIEQRLAEVIASGGKAGKKAQEELAAGLKSKDPVVRAQAERTQALVEHELDRIAALKAGREAGADLARGLNDKQGVVYNAAWRLGSAIVRAILGRISSATTGGGGASGGGAIRGMAGGGHAEADTVQWVGERGRELWVPDAPGSVVPQSDLRGIAGGPIIGGISISVDARGLPSPAATGAAVKQGVADAMADVFRDQSLRGLTGIKS